MSATYEWYQTGLSLLRKGDAHAAATVLERAVASDPDSGSLREALGRAYYTSRRFSRALEQFEEALRISPTNDYAHFGAGMCLGRLGRLSEGVGHLKLATVMRPGNGDYEQELDRQQRLRRLTEGGPPSDDERSPDTDGPPAEPGRGAGDAST